MAPAADLHAPGSHRRGRRILGAAVALCFLVFAALVRLAPEVERGSLLPWFADYPVSRVRLAGFELYADTSSGIADLLTVVALAATACGLAVVAGRLWRRGLPEARTFATAAAGAAFLAVDDLLAAHESVGHNLGVLARLPGIDHPDDVIVGLYAVAVGVFAWRHRDLASGTPLWPWIVGAIASTFAVVHDLLPVHAGGVEEVAEVVAGVALLAGVRHVVAPRLQGLPASRADRDLRYARLAARM